MRNIFISGGTASGKSTIIYLFDGHPKFLVSAIHLKLLEGFESLFKNFKDNQVNNYDYKFKYKDKKFYLTEKDLENILLDMNIANLQNYSKNKTYPNHTSSVDKEFLAFNFNYERFIFQLKENLKKNKNFYLTFENFYEIFYFNFFFNWIDKEFISSYKDFNEKYVVTKLPTNIESVQLSLNNFKNSKIIYVDRENLGIMKSRVLSFLKSRGLNLKDFDKYFYIFSKSDFFKKMNYQKKQIRILKKKFPNQIFLTSLENLINNTNEEMKKISSFINVKFEKLFTEATYLSKKIKDNHLQQINDDSFEVSEKSEFFFNIMNYNVLFYIKNKKFLYLKYFKQFILSFYLKVKFFIKKN